LEQTVAATNPQQSNTYEPTIAAAADTLRHPGKYPFAAGKTFYGAPTSRSGRTG